MDDFLKSLTGMPPAMSVTIMVLAVVLVTASKWGEINKALRWLGRRPQKRSCGDCILYMSGLKEKYQAEIEYVKDNVLRAQMNYVEIQLKDSVFHLSKTFKTDINVLAPDRPGRERVVQLSYYKETLKNALMRIKDEVRRSFKENGFCEISEIEFAQYVKMKFANIITIAREYMSENYIETEDTIVGLAHRFANFDDQKFEEMTFLCYRNAKQIVVDAKRQIADLKSEFKQEVDKFVASATGIKSPQCN